MSLRDNIIKSGLKEIPGFPGYFVSEYGDVYSIRSRKGDGRLRRLTACKSGRYLLVGLQTGKRGVNAKMHNRRIHTLVLTTFVGPRKSGQCTRHLDGNGTNNRLDNLAWGSYSENELDKRAHGRAPIGSRHGCAKLNERKVIQIRKLHSQGWLQEDIAIKFGISRPHVSRIISGKCWTHIKGEN